MNTRGSSVVHGALDGSMRGDGGNTKCDQYGGVCVGGDARRLAARVAKGEVDARCSGGGFYGR